MSSSAKVVSDSTIVLRALATPDGVGMDHRVVESRGVRDIEIPPECLWFHFAESLKLEVDGQQVLADLFDHSQVYFTRATKPSALKEVLKASWPAGAPASLGDMVQQSIVAFGALSADEKVVRVMAEGLPCDSMVVRPFGENDTVLNMVDLTGHSLGQIEGSDPNAETRRKRRLPYKVERQHMLRLILGKNNKGSHMGNMASDVELRHIPVASRRYEEVVDLPANIVAFNFYDICKVEVRAGLTVETEVFNRSPLHVVRVIADPCRFRDLVPAEMVGAGFILDGLMSMSMGSLGSNGGRIVTAETLDGTLKVPFPVNADDQILNMPNPYKK